MLALKEEKFILLTFFISSKRKPPTSFFKSSTIKVLSIDGVKLVVEPVTIKQPEKKI